MAAYALVLFDVDGCTAIVDSKKLVLEGKDLVNGQQGYMKFGREKLKVEILQLSDSKRVLNKFEDEWSTSRRSIALDKEKRKRRNKPDGYLAVWPHDVEDVVPAAEDLPDPNAEDQDLDENHTDDDEMEDPIKEKPTKTKETTEKTKEAKEKPKEKTGSKGRKITVLFEGGGDYSTDVATPKRAPYYLEELSADERYLINLQVEQYKRGLESETTQTEAVVILGPEDILPPLTSEAFQNILKLLQELKKGQQEMKGYVQELKKGQQDMKSQVQVLTQEVVALKEKQSGRNSVGSLLTTNELHELLVNSEDNSPVETAHGLEESLSSRPHPPLKVNEHKENGRITVHLGITSPDKEQMPTLSRPKRNAASTPNSVTTSSNSASTITRSSSISASTSSNSASTTTSSNSTSSSPTSTSTNSCPSSTTTSTSASPISSSISATTISSSANTSITSSSANTTNSSCPASTSTSSIYTSASSTSSSTNSCPASTTTNSFFTSASSTRGASSTSKSASISTTSSFASITCASDNTNSDSTTTSSNSNSSTTSNNSASSTTSNISSASSTTDTSNSSSTIQTTPVNSNTAMVPVNNFNDSFEETTITSIVPINSFSSLVPNSNPLSNSFDNIQSTYQIPAIPNSMIVSLSTSPSNMRTGFSLQSISNSPIATTNTALSTINIPQAANMLPSALFGNSPSPSTNRKALQFKCFPGQIIQIDGPEDFVGTPEDAEFRIRQKTSLTAASSACSKSNFGWILAQTIYKKDELVGRNFYGNRKNMAAISPRRRHAIEHAVAEVYGSYDIYLKEAISGINAGLRKLRNRRLPFSSLENV